MRAVTPESGELLICLGPLPAAKKFEPAASPFPFSPPSPPCVTYLQHSYTLSLLKSNCSIFAIFILKSPPYYFSISARHWSAHSNRAYACIRFHFHFSGLHFGSPLESSHQLI